MIEMRSPLRGCRLSFRSTWCPLRCAICSRALVPGGWLVVAVLGANPDPLSGALARLKLARYGTYSWTTTTAEAQLREQGFEQVATFSPDPRTVIIVGRKPAAG